MAARIATSSRVLASGQRSVSLTPLEKIHLTENDVRDPVTLHRALHRFIRAHEEVSRAYRSSPRMRAVIIEGLSFVAGQDLAPIQHEYGTIVRYLPVRWIGATTATACQYSESVNDGVRLVLHAITSGKADLEVWPV
jgi:hypothetical protein